MFIFVRGNYKMFCSALRDSASDTKFKFSLSIEKSEGLRKLQFVKGSNRPHLV